MIISLYEGIIHKVNSSVILKADFIATKEIEEGKSQLYREGKREKFMHIKHFAKKRINKFQFIQSTIESVLKERNGEFMYKEIFLVRYMAITLSEYAAMGNY